MVWRRRRVTIGMRQQDAAIREPNVHCVDSRSNDLRRAGAKWYGAIAILSGGFRRATISLSKTNRDDFTPATKRAIERQARGHCSNPACRRLTSARTSDGLAEISIGVASHICAAAPGGPRYDTNMTPQERSAAENGIWLCDVHARAVDSKDSKFTVEELRRWKDLTNADAWRSVMENIPYGPVATQMVPEDAMVRLRRAAEADLAAFRRSAKWPKTTVPLTLKVDRLGEAVTTRALAGAVVTFDDLILVAPPGMGKTTTLFQIAEGVLADGNGAPIVVPLGDWATDDAPLLSSILGRVAFSGISEDDFRAAAAQRGCILLLDGWNELDALARGRTRVQVEKLQRELPEIGLVISTRKQAMDVPFAGEQIDLMPLNEEQQMQIAVALRGDDGAKLVDESWRTPGVRELMTIPLYLTALLSLPEGAPFPTTKEEVLRHFVTAHERQAGHAEALQRVAHGFQQDYLDAIAVFATNTANTSVTDTSARSSISKTQAHLVGNGQLTIRTQPDAVLEVLVASHVLVRAGDAPGVSFQHQQFQEWYTSHDVERRMSAEIDDPSRREALKAEVFNLPAWEEAILFAVERMSRGDQGQKVTCGKGILAAFEVDPMLAAEMIYRATDDVWAGIAATVEDKVARWHGPGKSDRALRFMMNSGRVEFLDRIWPIITDANQQTSLKALRNCRRIRPSFLGASPASRILALPKEPRLVLLYEIASRSGIDGLDLATDIAKQDTDPQVIASVVDALDFRRADRHVARLLDGATEATFDLVAAHGDAAGVADEGVKRGLEAAYERRAKSELSTHERLRMIAFDVGGDDRSAEITQLVSTMTVGKSNEPEVQVIYEARERHHRAIAEGVLSRVRTGLKLFYGADDFLAAEGYSLDDDDLLQIAMDNPTSYDDRAEAAASVLGPHAVGKMVDEVLALAPILRTDRAASETYNGLQRRIEHVPGPSLVAAIVERSSGADSEAIARMATLLSRRPEDQGDRSRPYDEASIAAIQGLVDDWGKRMLASGNADRWRTSTVAALAAHAPDVRLLPTLRALLDDNLTRYRAFRAEAAATGYRQEPARSEAMHPWTHEYAHAFAAIDAPETASLMREYLSDAHFGDDAARVLVTQWKKRNDPPRDNRFIGRIDYRRVEERRTSFAADPTATCDEAEAIFAVIDTLIDDSATDEQKKHGVVLGIAAASLPHGQRDATISKLIALSPLRARQKLLLNLVHAGAVIESATVLAALTELIEKAKKDAWIWQQNEGWEVREWLRLIPYSDNPAAALTAVDMIPGDRRLRHLFDEMIDSLGETPSPGAEEALFRLAESHPGFYADRNWLDSVIGLGGLSSALRLADLIAAETVKARSSEGWHLSRQLGAMMAKHPELRIHVYGRLEGGASTRGLLFLAGAVAENPDADGLLLLAKLGKDTRSLLSWRTIESVVTEHVPVPNWKGAYNVVPVDASFLRERLFSEVTDGGADDAAARWLTTIDKIRDEHGLPISEPRHPDLRSGKPWPILRADPDADE